MSNEMYRSNFTKNDFLEGDVSVLANQFVRLGEYKVEAGELIRMGYGMLAGQESAQGRIYIDLQDSNGAIEGEVRIMAYSPQDRPLKILHEFRTETLRTSGTDRTKQIPYPLDIHQMSEDRKIVIEFRSDSNGTLNKANSNILIDITRGVE